MGFVNGFSRGVSRVQKELKENGNGEAKFDFSLISAFKVIEYRSNRAEEIAFISTTDIIGDNGQLIDTSKL